MNIANPNLSNFFHWRIVSNIFFNYTFVNEKLKLVLMPLECCLQISFCKNIYKKRLKNKVYGSKISNLCQNGISKNSKCRSECLKKFTKIYTFIRRDTYLIKNFTLIKSFTTIKNFLCEKIASNFLNS